MTTGYKIYDQSQPHYMTLQVIDWVDVFTRSAYKELILESFDFCRKEKGLLLYAYVIMTNHIHLIARAQQDFLLSDILRDFKKFTANKLLDLIKQPSESRRDWMLKRFEFAALGHQRNRNFQFWTHENHAIELHSKEFIEQRLNYIHLNPVRAGIVENPEDYLFNSARNYGFKPAKLEIDSIFGNN